MGNRKLSMKQLMKAINLLREKSIKDLKGIIVMREHVLYHHIDGRLTNMKDGTIVKLKAID